MDKQFDLAPKLEPKCKHCGHGKGSHKADTFHCPIGQVRRGSFNQFHSEQTFVDSGKHTIASKNVLKKYEEQEARRQQMRDIEAREKAKVRSMTLEEVIAAARDIIFEHSGLLCLVERAHERSVNLHVISKHVRLGYTSVTQTTNGSYFVGGTYAGCFMANSSDKDITNVIRDDFKALEERANAEKV
jgi:hypothetical protein